MFLPVKMGELWPSCGRVVPSIGRVVAELSEFLGELLGEIVKFRQLAQKRLGGHLCLGGRIANVFYVIFIIFSPVGHFSGDPHAVPPQKWVSGGFWGVLRQKT